MSHSTDRVDRAGLQVALPVDELIHNSALPGTGIDAGKFWEGAAAIIERFMPRNAALLERRNELQAQIDAWYKALDHVPTPAEEESKLIELGYLLADQSAATVVTENVDPEIAEKSPVHNWWYLCKTHGLHSTRLTLVGAACTTHSTEPM